MTTTLMALDTPRERLYEIKDEMPLVFADGEIGVGREYLLTLRDMPREEKPREKLIKHGPGVLTSSELLAVILGVGTTKEDALVMARRLIKEYGESIVGQRDPKKISQLLDIPVVKACQIVACVELGKRFFKMPDAKTPVSLRQAAQVFEYAKDMRILSKEHLRGLYLDAHYRLIHDELISVGTKTLNVVNPPEVFRPALEWDASAVILVHNHPTGVVTPSPLDIDITKRLVAVGQLLSIPILDHVVVTKDKFQSVPVEY